MNLPKFKNYISNTIASTLFDHVDIYGENLYSKDSAFEVSNFSLPHATKEDMDSYKAAYKIKRDLVESLDKSPNVEDVVNGEFSFVIHFDSCMLGTGVSLKQLNKMAKKLHTDNIFVNGDGNDYQLGEYTGGHDSEIILHIEFKGNKEQLVADYQKWYVERQAYLQKKIDEKSQKIKNKQ